MPAAAPAPERLTREQTLRRSSEYRRCYARGRRWRGELASVVVLENRQGSPRLGITASRRVGGAVVRNRLKRQVRERFRRHPARQEIGGADLVVELRREATVNRRELGLELDGLLAKIAAERRDRR